MTKDYIETFTGKRVNPVRLVPSDIDIRDIAHSLSLICRYNGHCREFYSVAQHCVMVAKIARQRFKSFYFLTNYATGGCGPGVGGIELAALLHDASEAYLSDVPSPLKSLLINYEEIEAGVLAVVYERFLGRQPNDAEFFIVKTIDKSIWQTEVFNLFDDWRSWEGTFDADLLYTIDIWTSERAEREFLKTYECS